MATFSLTPRPNIVIVARRIALMSCGCACTGCLCAKTSSCWTSPAPLRAACKARSSRAFCCASVPADPRTSSSELAIAVRMLLKSCAMPPVS
jgi:hypothetical protein